MREPFVFAGPPRQASLVDAGLQQLAVPLPGRPRPQVSVVSLVLVLVLVLVVVLVVLVLPALVLG